MVCFRHWRPIWSAVGFPRSLQTPRLRRWPQRLPPRQFRLYSSLAVTRSSSPTVAVQRETRTIPIVFATAADPVLSGLVARVNQPGGNITGFAFLEPTLGGKWLELLSEIAPGLKRAAFMFNPDTAIASAFMPSLETAARSLKVEPIIAHIHGVPAGV